MGYPLLVKAVMGGGGKGMKLAQAPNQFLVRLPAACWLLVDLLPAVLPAALRCCQPTA